MPAPYAGIARARIIGRNHAGQTVNVCHFATNIVGYDAANPADALTRLATALLECVRDALLPAVPSDWRLIKITAQGIGPTLSDEVEVQALGTDIGEGTASDVSFAAQLLSLKTGKGGRSKRGRMFCPPPPEDGVTESALTPGQVALLAAFAACLATKFLTPNGTQDDWRLAVLSRKLLAANNNNFDLAVTEVTTITANSLVATMRSRKFGKGS